MIPLVTLKYTSRFNDGDTEKDWLKFDIKLYKEDDVPIGSAEIFWFDATHHSPADLRSQADSWEFHLYQILSSVRIYPTEDEAERDKEMGFLQHDQSIFEPMGLHDSFLKRGQYEKKKFKIKTGLVWGKIALMRSFNIEEAFRQQGYGTESMKQILSFFEEWGTDFLLLKPFPPERQSYIDEETDLVNLKKLKKEIRGLVHFYQRLGCRETIGRCDELSMYCRLKPKGN